MLFEWDPAKRHSNLAKHGLDLLARTVLFNGAAVYSYPSDRLEEPRWVTVGMIADVAVALVWTRRGAAIRLISLRRARNAEIIAYRARFGG
jgi:uncharacterized DUF497 family protein